MYLSGGDRKTSEIESLSVVPALHEEEGKRYFQSD